MELPYPALPYYSTAQPYRSMYHPPQRRHRSQLTDYMSESRTKLVPVDGWLKETKLWNGSSD